MQAHTMMDKPTQSFESIEKLFMDSIVCRVVKESIRMQIFDILETPQFLSRISEITRTNERAMESLLDLLVFQGLVEKDENKYVNSPLSSEYLVSTSLFYQGNAVLLMQHSYDSILGSLSSLLKNPGLARECIGQKFASEERMKGVMQQALRGSLQDATEFVALLPGFQSMHTLCDIGGNHGRYAMALLERNPALSAVIADLPEVIKVSENHCKESDYAQRLFFLPFDLGKNVLPHESYDLVLTSHVLHLFRENLDSILEKIASSINPGGWFVTHNLNPECEADTFFRPTMNLVSCLIAKTNHFIPHTELEQALRNIGFRDFMVEKTGPGGRNSILAARKQWSSWIKVKVERSAVRNKPDLIESLS